MNSNEFERLLAMSSAQDKRQILRDLFRQNGRSIGKWADEMGFKRTLVYAVLSGRALGERGEAHHIALALGIKAQPSIPIPGAGEPGPSSETSSAAADNANTISKKEVA